MKNILSLISICFWFTVNSNSNELTNNLKSSLDQLLNETLSEMFQMAECGVSPGNTNEVKKKRIKKNLFRRTIATGTK